MIATAAIDRAAQADILAVAHDLGARLRRVSASEWAGPCPACGGRDRFSVNTKKRVWRCRCCAKGGDVIALMQHVNGATFGEAVAALAGEAQAVVRVAPPRAVSSDPSEDADRVRDLKIAARIVAQIVRVIGMPGEDYLRQIRKIDTAAIADVLERTDAIGWHPGVYFNQPDPAKEHHELHGKRFGAIIAILTDPVTAKPTGAVSRTYLRPDLTKIGKAKSLAGSGIVRLSLDEDVLLGLHLAEGLETGLYAMAQGFRPLWSTGSTSLLASFPVLGGIECLTVLADRDRNEAGERAAKAVAARWREAGRETRILRPREVLGDLNDIELRRAE